MNKMIKYFISVFLFTYICNSRIQSQTFDPYFQSIVDSVSYDTIFKNLQTFQSFGVKTVNTPAIDSTLSWILSQYTNYGYTDISIDSFYLYGRFQYNAVITKTGKKYPNTYLIVNGHYDTQVGPGTDDNGSGTCVILEMARVLRNIDTEYSIKFIHFTCEEIGGHGSHHYVDSVVIPQNMDIKLEFNIDMVGGVAGLLNDTLICESDQSPPISNNAQSYAYTDTVRTLTELYSSLKTVHDSAWGSDYISFHTMGYVITGYFEYNFNPNYHSEGDTLGNLDTSYVFEVTKGGTGSILYLSNAYNSSEITENTLSKENIIVYPNPTSGNLNIRSPKNSIINIFNINGQIGKSLNNKNGLVTIDLVDFPNGIYMIQVITKETVITKIITKD